MRRKTIINVFITIFILPLCLTACNSSVSNENARPISESASLKQNSDDKEFVMTVFGAIHSGHRRSDQYSLDVLKKAVRNFKPDTIFIEIPPSSLEQAKSSFEQFGEVRERRTRAFPELTDVVFPLQKELGYDLIATAGWSRQLANDRAAILKRIENDPKRQTQWNEHIAARNNLFKVQRQNQNDPLYIHTDQYDSEVKVAQTPYETYFDKDIGAGGWGPINDAHIALMIQGLDKIKAQSGDKGEVSSDKPHHITLVDARQFFVAK